MNCHILVLEFDPIVVDSRSEQVLRARSYLDACRKLKSKANQLTPSLHALSSVIDINLFDYPTSSTEEVHFERYLKGSLYLVRNASDLFLAAIFALDCTLNGEVFSSFEDNLAEIAVRFRELRKTQTVEIVQLIQDTVEEFDREFIELNGIEKLSDLFSIHPQVLPILNALRDDDESKKVVPYIVTCRPIEFIRSILEHHLLHHNLEKCRFYHGSLESQLQSLVKSSTITQISVLVDDAVHMRTLRNSLKCPHLNFYYASWGRSLGEDLAEYFSGDIANQDKDTDHPNFLTSVANLL